MRQRAALRERRVFLAQSLAPPDSAIGALRWEKLVEYAGQRGWSFDVLMIDPAQSEVRDDSRLTRLPPGVRLFGVRDLQPSGKLGEKQKQRRRLARLDRHPAPCGHRLLDDSLCGSGQIASDAKPRRR